MGALEARLAKLEAMAERTAPRPTADLERKLLDSCFPEQRAFVEDKSRLQALIATRRSGKSYALGLKLFKAALDKPGSTSVYLGLTRDSSMRIMVKDVLRPINRQFGLRATFTKVPLAVSLPNGSVIYLLGVDSDEDERAKALGQKLALAVVDEVGSFRTDLYELVYKVLKPATADLGGSIVLTSTPANVKRGLFFELTKDQDPCSPGTWQGKAKLEINGKPVTLGGWSGHRWSAFQNPNVKWQQEIDELIASSPGIEDTPGFIQEYYGRWFIDQSKLVYRYLAGRNDYETLPVYDGKGHWHKILAVDIGFDDPTSLSLLTWHDFDPNLYVEWNYAESGLDVTAVAEKIQDQLDAHPEIERTIIDGANKQAVAELRNRHGLALEAAEKMEKMEFIAIMNSDFIRGKIKIHSSCQELKDELGELVLNDRSMKKEEHPACRNDRCDSVLYGWRTAYNYLAEPLPDVPPKGTDAYLNWRAHQDDLESIRQAQEEERRRKLFFGTLTPPY